MDKRGQVDKALEAMPVFFAVMVILILFTLLSAGVFGFKKLSERDAELSSVGMPLLFEEVSLQEGSRMTVIEAFRNTSGNSEDRKKLFEQVSDMTPANGCLVFTWIDWSINSGSMDGGIYIDPSTVPFGFVSYMKDGKAVIVDAGSDDDVSFYKRYRSYSESKLLQSARLRFTEDNSDLTFMTYSGRCIDE